MRRGARSTSVPQLIVVLYALAAGTHGAGAETSSAPIAHVSGDLSDARRRQDTATTRLFEAGGATVTVYFASPAYTVARRGASHPFGRTKDARPAWFRGLSRWTFVPSLVVESPRCKFKSACSIVPGLPGIPGVPGIPGTYNSGVCALFLKLPFSLVCFPPSPPY